MNQLEGLRVVARTKIWKREVAVCGQSSDLYLPDPEVLFWQSATNGRLLLCVGRGYYEQGKLEVSGTNEGRDVLRALKLDSATHLLCS